MREMMTFYARLIAQVLERRLMVGQPSALRGVTGDRQEEGPSSWRRPQ